MKDFQILPYGAEHFEGVERLWREAFPDDPPWNAAESAIPTKASRVCDRGAREHGEADMNIAATFRLMHRHS